MSELIEALEKIRFAAGELSIEPDDEGWADYVVIRECTKQALAAARVISPQHTTWPRDCAASSSE